MECDSSLLSAWLEEVTPPWPPSYLKRGEEEKNKLMHILFNNSKLKERRKELRRQQTPSEAKLWSELRGEKFHNLKFYRQYSVGYYILDFYCPKKKLAIELDGSHHFSQNEALYDQERTLYLNAAGIEVLRFQNQDIENNLTAALEKITFHLLPPS